ncbi:unnamed protein product [Rotaria sp. Silwood1]|nr:unnamed protein product [Rotaria sp. Silwood1]
MDSSSSSTKNKPLVVITGASSGIGEACARSFSAAGHPLLLIARRLDRLQALKLPDNVICAQVDVTDRAKLKEVIEKAVEKYGPVDCLVNNAGVMLLGKVQTQNPEEWQRMFDVNLMGVLNGTHVVLPSMSK